MTCIMKCLLLLLLLLLLLQDCHSQGRWWVRISTVYEVMDGSVADLARCHTRTRDPDDGAITTHLDCVIAVMQQVRQGINQSLLRALVGFHPVAAHAACRMSH
jgi:hypothetical protein